MVEIKEDTYQQSVGSNTLEDPPLGEFGFNDILPCGIDFPLHCFSGGSTSFSDWEAIETLSNLLVPPSPNIPKFHNQRKASPNLRFLKRITLSFGLAFTFECGTNNERRIVSFEIVNNNYETWDGSFALMTGLQSQMLQTKTFAGLGCFADPLAQTTTEIVDLLRRSSELKSEVKGSMLPWSPSMEDACLQFFAPAHLRRFLNLFWASWYPNCPIIHKPSFGTKPFSGVLFTTITVLGACLSSEKADIEFAKRLLDYVEEAVFASWSSSQGDMSRKTTSNLTNCPPRPQALQAMLLVCVLQNWEGSVESKRRIWYYRYPIVTKVSQLFLFDGIQHALNPAKTSKAARSFQKGSATHNGCQWDGATESWWHHFISREELIRYCL